jgi:hypothetical protein
VTEKRCLKRQKERQREIYFKSDRKRYLKRQKERQRETHFKRDRKRDRQK